MRGKKMPNLIQLKKLSERFICRKKNRKEDRDWYTWVFGEWFGSKCNDNCLALANYISKQSQDIKVVWIAQKNCKDVKVLNKEIYIVEKNSEDAISILKKAGVVFVNEGLQDLTDNGYNYSAGSIIVNLWHGIPWKKIGMDSYHKGQVFNRLYAKIIYNLQEFSYFPSPSDKCTEKLISGFMLKGEDQIIKAGLPRNSLFYDSELVENIRKKIIFQLKKKCLQVDEKAKIITYMPTFRDKSDNSFDFGKLLGTSQFNSVLSKYNAVIIQKSHIVNQIRNDTMNNNIEKRVITCNEYAAQELMAASDILITDYSSCFFDFLILNRPIIHYLYDYDYYLNDDRGLYYNKEDVVCGDVAQSEDELLDVICSNLENPQKDEQLRRIRKQQFMTYESPDACKIITDFIIKQIKSK